MIVEWKDYVSVGLMFVHIFHTTGLKITAGQRTMSGLIEALTGQKFDLPVMLTGQN